MFYLKTIVLLTLFSFYTLAAEPQLLSKPYVKEFEKNLSNANLSKKLELISSLKSQVTTELKSELKKKNKNKALIFELIQYKNALQLIEEKNFDPKKCDDYKTHFIFSYHPQKKENEKPVLSEVTNRVYFYLVKQLCSK